MLSTVVIPAKAGTQLLLCVFASSREIKKGLGSRKAAKGAKEDQKGWVPAFAGMTNLVMARA